MNSQLQSTLLLTQVPFFGTEVKGDDATNAHHEVKTYVDGLPDDSDIILARFARFVAGISDTSQPSFCAQLPEGGYFVDYEVPFASVVEAKRGSLGMKEQNSAVSQGDHFCISILVSSFLVADDFSPSLLSRFNTGIGLESLEEMSLQQSIHGMLTRGISAENAALVHAAFEKQAQDRADNILIEYLYRDDESSMECTQNLTYKDVHIRATALAEQLVEIERYADWKPMVEQQRAVPILLPTFPELIIAIFAVLKAGYAVCPLAVDRPADSLLEILGDLNAVPVIGLGENGIPTAAHSHKNSQRQEKARYIWVDVDNVGGWRKSRIFTPPVIRQLPVVTPSDIAYVIFTSGSTGKPKGVLVSHRAMATSISNFSRRVAHLPTGPKLRWFVMNLPSFDAYQLDVLHVILRGGTLCMAERGLVLTDVEGTINRLRATATTTVSSLAVILRPEKLPTLQTIVAGGEMLHQQVVANFGRRHAVSARKRGPPVRYLINGYGPTETAIVVATEEMSLSTRGSIIGDALSSAIIVIIDPLPDSVHELPAGVPGELAIGGPQLSWGYLNRPEETSRAFVNHATLGRLYRTGDKARVVWAKDGQRKIEILGRLTLDQVKINGRRMELGEVESCLLKVPFVREAAVVVIQGTILVAFLVLQSGQSMSETEVQLACQRHTSQHLAQWMCPSRYKVVQALPRTPNDKVDRRALTSSMEQQNAAENSKHATEQSAQHTSTSDQTKGPNDEEKSTEVIRIESVKNDPDTQPPSKPTTTAGIPTPSSLSASEQQDVTTQDAVEIVYKGLATAIGGDVRSHHRETPTSNIGLDSIRAMTLLRVFRAEGVMGLGIMDVLSASRIEDLITKVQNVIVDKACHDLSSLRQQKDIAACAQQAAVNGGQDAESKIEKKISNITDSGSQASSDGEPSSLDTEHLKSIQVDDEDAIYELDTEAKLWHYNYHCRSACAKRLDLDEKDIKQVLPATGIQMRLLYLATDPLYNDSHRYQGKPQIDHVLYQVPADMDINRLQRAIEAVVNRFDIFRTVFTPTKHPLAEFAQVVLKSDAPLAALQTRSIYVDSDTGHVSSSAAWKEKLTLAQENAEQSLTLETPSIRVTYVQSLDKRHCVVVFSLFHAIYDGVSFRLFRAAVAAEYEGVALSTELLHFRSAVEQHLAADWLDTILFLMSRYANVPVFRTGRLRPRASSTREYDELHYRLYPSSSHMRRFSIQSHLTLNELMGQKQRGVPMSGQAVVQAAWTKMLSQTTRPSQHADKPSAETTYIEFTTAVHGRYTDVARRTMGPLLAGVPMMIPISDIRADNRSNRDVCNLLSTQHRQLLCHIAMPCPNMEMAQVGMDRSDTGLVLQIHDLEQEAADARAQVPDLPMFHHDLNLLPPYKPLDTGFVIMVEVWPGVGGPDDNLTIICSYNSQRPGYEFLSRSWVLSALVSFDEAMGDILEHPDSPFCAAPAVTNGHD
ncbi:hypothetical protein V2A60_007234 [Cordyceps javanica]